MTSHTELLARLDKEKRAHCHIQDARTPFFSQTYYCVSIEYAENLIAAIRSLEAQLEVMTTERNSYKINASVYKERAERRLAEVEGKVAATIAQGVRDFRLRAEAAERRLKWAYDSTMRQMVTSCMSFTDWQNQIDVVLAPAEQNKEQT